MASLLMAPLKHYIGSLLRSYLGTFVVGVELDALGFLGSEIVLNDVELATDALNALVPNSPLVLLRGFVKTLRIGIPWASLLSSPVTVSLDTIEVVLARGHGQGGGSPSQPPETSALLQPAVPSALPDWLMQMLTRVLANVTLTLSNVIVRVQHAGVEVTLTLQRAHAASADSSAGWAEAFVDFTGPQQLLSKQVELRDVSVTCNALAPHCTSAPAAVPHLPSRSRVGSRASEASAPSMGGGVRVADAAQSGRGGGSVGGGGGVSSGTPFHGDSLLLEEPLLSRCNVYARLSVPLAYVMGTVVSTSTAVAAAVGSEDVVSGTASGGRVPSGGLGAAVPVGSVPGGGDPFACHVLQAYPNGLAVRSFVQQHAPQDSGKRDDEGHIPAARPLGPCISTSVDASGAFLQVVADSLEASASVEQLRMLTAFCAGWKPTPSRSTSVHEGLRMPPGTREMEPMVGNASSVPEGSSSTLAPSVPKTLPPSLPSEAPGVSANAATNIGWLGWAFTTLLTGDDDEARGESLPRTPSFAPDRAAPSPPDSVLPNSETASSPPPLAATINFLVGSIALVLRRHATAGVHVPHSPPRPSSESGVTATSFDQSTLTIDGHGLHAQAPDCEILRVPVARLGFVTVASTPAGAGSGGGRSNRSAASRRLPVPFFRAQVVCPTLHARILAESLASPTSEALVAARLVDAYVDVGAISAGHWGVDAEAVHSHHIRARQLLVRQAALSSRVAHSTFRGGASGDLASAHAGPPMADLTDGAQCECLRGQSCCLFWGSSEDVRVSSAVDELTPHPYFASSSYPAADAILAGSSAADAGVLHHLSARLRVALWQCGEHAAPQATIVASLSSIHGVADATLVRDVSRCGDALIPVASVDLPDNELYAPPHQSSLQLPCCVRLAARSAGASVVIPAVRHAPPVLLLAGLAEIALDCHTGMRCSSEAPVPPPAAQFPLLRDYRKLVTIACPPCDRFEQRCALRFGLSSIQCVATEKRKDAGRGAPALTLHGFESDVNCTASSAGAVWRAQASFERVNVSLAPQLFVAGIGAVSQFIDGISPPPSVVPLVLSAYPSLHVHGAQLMGSARLLTSEHESISAVCNLSGRIGKVMIDDNSTSGPRLHSAWSHGADPLLVGASVTGAPTAPHFDSPSTSAPCLELSLLFPLLIRLPPAWFASLNSIALFAPLLTEALVRPARSVAATLRSGPCLLHADHINAIVNCVSAIVAGFVTVPIDPQTSPCERQLMPALDVHGQSSSSNMGTILPIESTACGLSISSVDLGSVDLDVAWQQWTFRFTARSQSGQLVDFLLPGGEVKRDTGYRGEGLGVSWKAQGGIMAFPSGGVETSRDLAVVACSGTATVQVSPGHSAAVEAITKLGVHARTCAVSACDEVVAALLDTLPLSLPEEVRCWLVGPVTLPPLGSSRRWDTALEVTIDQLEMTLRSVSLRDARLDASHVAICVEWQGLVVSSISCSAADLSSSLRVPLKLSYESPWVSVSGVLRGQPCLALSYKARDSSLDGFASGGLLDVSCGMMSGVINSALITTVTSLSNPVCALGVRVTELLFTETSAQTATLSALLLEPESQLLLQMNSAALNVRIAAGPTSISVDKSLLPLRLSWHAIMMSEIRRGGDDRAADAEGLCTDVIVRVSQLACDDVSTGVAVLKHVDCTVVGEVSRGADLSSILVSWAIEMGPLCAEASLSLLRSAQRLSASELVSMVPVQTAALPIADPPRARRIFPRVTVSRACSVRCAEVKATLRIPRQTSLAGFKSDWVYTVDVGKIDLVFRALSNEDEGVSNAPRVTIASTSASFFISRITLEAFEESSALECREQQVADVGSRAAISAAFGGDSEPFWALHMSSDVSPTCASTLNVSIRAALCGGDINVSLASLEPMVMALCDVAVLDGTSQASSARWDALTTVAHPINFSVILTASRACLRALFPDGSVMCSGVDSSGVSSEVSAFLSPDISAYPSRPSYPFFADSRVTLSGLQVFLEVCGFPEIRLPPRPLDIHADAVVFSLTRGQFVDPIRAIVRCSLPPLTMSIDPTSVSAVGALVQEVLRVHKPASILVGDNLAASPASTWTHRRCDVSGASSQSIVLLRDLTNVPSDLSNTLTDLTQLPLAAACRLGGERSSLSALAGTVSFDDTVCWTPSTGGSGESGGWWGSVRIAVECPVYFSGLSCLPPGLHLPERPFQRLHRRFPGQLPLLLATPPPPRFSCFVEGLVDRQWVQVASVSLPVRCAEVPSPSEASVELFTAVSSLLSRCWRLRWHEVSLSSATLRDLSPLLGDFDNSRTCRHEPYSRVSKALVDSLALYFSSRGSSLVGLDGPQINRNALSDVSLMVDASLVEFSFLTTQSRESRSSRFAALRLPSSICLEVQRCSQAVCAPLVICALRAAPSLIAVDPTLAFGAVVLRAEAVISISTGCNVPCHSVHAKIVNPVIKITPALAQSLVAGGFALMAAADVGSLRSSVSCELRPVLFNRLHVSVEVRQAGALAGSPETAISASSTQVFTLPSPASEVRTVKAIPQCGEGSPCHAIQIRAVGSGGRWSTPLALGSLAGPMLVGGRRELVLCWRSIAFQEGSPFPVWTVAAEWETVERLPVLAQVLQTCRNTSSEAQHASSLSRIAGLALAFLPPCSIVNHCDFDVLTTIGSMGHRMGHSLTLITAASSVVLPDSALLSSDALGAMRWSRVASTDSLPGVSNDDFVIPTSGDVERSCTPWVRGLGIIFAPSVEHRVTLDALRSRTGDFWVITRALELRRRRGRLTPSNSPALSFLELFPVLQVLLDRGSKKLCGYNFNASVTLDGVPELEGQLDASPPCVRLHTSAPAAAPPIDSGTENTSALGSCLLRAAAGDFNATSSVSWMTLHQRHAREGSLLRQPLVVRSGAGLDVVFLESIQLDVFPRPVAPTGGAVIAECLSTSRRPLQVTVSAGLVFENKLGISAEVFVSRVVPFSRAISDRPRIDRPMNTSHVSSGETVELPLHVHQQPISQGNELAFCVALGLGLSSDAAIICAGSVAPLRVIVLPLPRDPSQVTTKRVSIPTTTHPSGSVVVLISLSQRVTDGPVTVTATPALQLVNRSSVTLQYASALPIASPGCSNAVGPTVTWGLHGTGSLVGGATVESAPILQLEGADFSVLCLRGEGDTHLPGAWSAVRLHVPFSLGSDENCEIPAMPSALAVSRVAASTLEAVELWAGPAVSGTCRAVRVPIAWGVAPNTGRDATDLAAFPLQTCIVLAVQEQGLLTVVTVDNDSASPLSLSNASSQHIYLQAAEHRTLPAAFQHAFAGDFVEHLAPCDASGRAPRTVGEMLARAEIKLRGRIAAAMPGPEEAAAIDSDMQLVACAKSRVSDILALAGGDAAASPGRHDPAWPTSMLHPLQICAPTASRTEPSLVAVELRAQTKCAAFDWLLLCESGSGGVTSSSTEVVSEHKSTLNTNRVFWWPPTVALPSVWDGDRLPDALASESSALFPHAELVSDESCRMALALEPDEGDGTVAILEGVSLHALRPHCAFEFKWRSAVPAELADLAPWSAPVSLLSGIEEAAAALGGQHPSHVAVVLESDFRLSAAAIGGQLLMTFDRRLPKPPKPVSLALECSHLSVALLHGSAYSSSLDASPFYIGSDLSNYTQDHALPEDAAAVKSMRPWWAVGSSRARDYSDHSHDYPLDSSVIVHRTGLVATAQRLSLRLVPREGFFAGPAPSAAPALGRTSLTVEVELLSLRGHDHPSGLLTFKSLDATLPRVGLRVDLIAERLQAINFRLPEARLVASDDTVKAAMSLVDEFLAASRGAAGPMLANHHGPRLHRAASDMRPLLTPPSLVSMDRFTLGSTNWDVTLHWKLPVPPYFVNVDRMPLHTEGVDLLRVVTPRETLVRTIAANVVADALVRLPVLLGALGAIGNPTVIISALASGISGLFLAPLRSALQSRSAVAAVVSALGAVGESSVLLLQRVSSAILVSVSSSSSALSALLSDPHPEATETAVNFMTTPFDFDDGPESETMDGGPGEATTPVPTPFFRRFLSGASYVFQAVAMSSRAGAAALEQRPPAPPQEHHELGYAVALPVQHPADESRDPRHALSGIDSHALVLCRDLGPNGVCVSRMRAWPACARFDSGEWQRGVLVVDSAQAHRTPVVAPLLSAAFGSFSLPQPVTLLPMTSLIRSVAQVPTVAATGIPVRSSGDTASSTDMVGAAPVAEQRLQAPDAAAVTQALRTIELLNHVGTFELRGYVLVDAFPASRDFRVTRTDGGASGSGPPGTVLLRADGCSLVIPDTALPAILGPETETLLGGFARLP